VTPATSGLHSVREVCFVLYQLVIRVKGIRVCALDCVRAGISFSHFIRSFVHRRVHHILVSRVSGIASAKTTLAVSAVAPLSKHFSAAANQKPFGNKDLCTRKSAKTNCKEVRAKRLASAW